MVQIEWTERSLEDLKEIHDYIARDSKNYANLFVCEKNI
jgi:plasmid stabilization system protein ParE